MTDFLSNPVMPGRYDFGRGISPELARRVVADPGVKVLQTAVPVEPHVWDLLNSEVLAERPDIEIRVFGFYSSPCDLAFLKRLPNVTRFSADCLTRASGIEYLAGLERLENLSIGIYSLENFDFLSELPAESMKELSLHATRSKRPDISAIRRFPHLRKLYIEGQQKGIESIADLLHLEMLTLRSVSPVDLKFLHPLAQLWSLEIKLGGASNLNALEGMSQIKYLELWQIRGLNDVDVFSSLTGLQYLFLQSLKNVERMPDLSQLKKLRRLFLENMKGLKDLSGLSSAPALQEFIQIMSYSDPGDYEDFLRLPTLKKVSVGFGSDKKNGAFWQLAAPYGFEDYCPSEFRFL